MTEKSVSLSMPSLPWKVRPGWLARMANSSWQLSALPFLLFIVLPITAIFLRTSLADLLENLNHPQVIKAVNLSLLTSLISTAVAWILGTPVAYLLAQRRFRFRRLVDTLIDLPTVLPPAVAGVALLMAFGRRGLFGPWLDSLDINIPFTMPAVVIAQTFVASSFYIKAAALGFGAIDPELKQAASLDGASRVQVFRHITLPLSWAALLSGSVMTWARALGEFGATIIFAGNFPGRTQTMPLAIYVGFEISQSIALTLAIILISFSFLTLVIIKGLLYNRLEADA
ncbi:MAG: ABC transporter permease [Chloroflexota bacterium]